MSGNSRKDRFLASIPTASLGSPDNNLALRCKFNFSYFTEQPAGQTFSDWGGPAVIELCGKLKEFSQQPLTYWMTRPVGKSGTVLTIYGDFPKPSEFEHPKAVPIEAQWGRFRLDWSSRLVGFVVPKAFQDEKHECGHRFDCNTFYVVFLDENHVFYKGKEAK